MPREPDPDDFVTDDELVSYADHSYEPSLASSPVAHIRPASRQQRPSVLINKLLQSCGQQGSHRVEKAQLAGPSNLRMRNEAPGAIYDIPLSPGASQVDDADANPGSDAAPDSFDLSQWNNSGLPIGERSAVVSGRSRLARHAEGLLEDSDISDFWDEGDDLIDSDDEELNFAPAETQLEADLHRDLSEGEAAIPDCQDVGKLEGWHPHEHDEFARLVRAIDEQGWNPVILHALKAEADSGSVLGARYAKEKPVWKEMAYLTLSPMHPHVLAELTHGNLVLAAQANKELDDLLMALHERCKSQPIIYARVHVDASGKAMSTADALRLVKWLRRYMADEESILNNENCQNAIWRVDREFSKRWRRTDTNEGARRFLATKSGTRSEDRLDVLRKFSDRLEARCEAADDGSGTTLLSPPLLYIGYAARGDIRQRQHEACGSSSNWLATLVQSFCNVVWGRGSFRMHFFAICPLSEEQQGPVAEMLLTRIPGAYYHNGGGFCIDIAGKSMESIHFNKLNAAQREERWNDFGDWIDQNTPANKNWEKHENADNLRKEQLQAKRQTQEEEIEAYIAQVAEAHYTCQAHKTHELWQTPEQKELVRSTEQLWVEVHEKFPEYFE